MSATEGTPLAEAVGDSNIMSPEDTPSSWLEEHDSMGDDEAETVHEMDMGMPGVKEEAAEEAAPVEDTEAASTTEEGETDAASVEEEAATGEEDGDYEKAISALRRAKLSKEVIGTLSRDQILKEGLAMADGQAQIDAKFDEHSRTVQELKADRDGKESGKEPGDVESTGHASTATLQAATKEFAEALGLDEGDVGPSLTKFGEAVTGPMRDQMTQGVEVLTTLDRIVGSLLHRAARAELSTGEQARFPQLADNAVYQTVQAKAQQLMAGGSYSNMDPADSMVEALSDAAGIVLRPQIQKEAASKATKDRAAKAKGGIARPGSQKVAKETTEFERSSSLLDKLESADTR